MERTAAAKGFPVNHPAREALANTYSRALVSMHKMPRIWTEYLEFMVDQKYVTRTRRAFDKALMALPVTQHDRIWVIYLKFISQPGIPVETAARVRWLFGWEKNLPTPFDFGHLINDLHRLENILIKVKIY